MRNPPASVKEPWEIDVMRQAGAIVARGLALLEEMVKPGISTADLDAAFENHVRKSEAVPTFKGYRGFPASICASLNEEVVHGIPSPKRILKDGDILKIDAGATFKGYVGDAAITIALEPVKASTKLLVEAARGTLEEAIRILKPGLTLGELGKALQEYSESRGFGVVRKFCGHGIGKAMHEEPNIPNYLPEEPAVRNFVLKAGHCIAVEPMLTLGSGDVRVMPDNWTVVSKDRTPAAHWEHTIAITEAGCEVLTRRHDK
jgi:methionyl aminopeptidase